MKERPILFSAPMVRAILDGTKRRTRRTSKLPTDPRWEFNRLQDGYPDGVPRAVFYYDGEEPAGFKCPYGAPGDRLWVRETFAAPWGRDYRLPGETKPAIFYRADGPDRPDDGAWKPSIHMPRWASRITLAVESVRVERLHDITEEDARAEGVALDGRPIYLGKGRGRARVGTSIPTTYRVAFEQLWRDINGAESWVANPWVWVIGFSRVTP